jgi:hypothetical protein
MGLGTVAVLEEDKADLTPGVRRKRLLKAWPVKDTNCGLSGLESLMVRLPVEVPAVEPAWKVTEMVQFAPAATLLPHGLFSLKRKLDVVMLVTVRAEVPVLVSVTSRGTLEVLRGAPRIRLVGISITVPLVRVIVPETALLVSATEVAVIVTAATAGTAAGAV